MTPLCWIHHVSSWASCNRWLGVCGQPFRHLPRGLLLAGGVGCGMRVRTRGLESSLCTRVRIFLLQIGGGRFGRAEFGPSYRRRGLGPSSLPRDIVLSSFLSFQSTGGTVFPRRSSSLPFLATSSYGSSFRRVRKGLRAKGSVGPSKVFMDYLDRGLPDRPGRVPKLGFVLV